MRQLHSSIYGGVEYVRLLCGSNQSVLLNEIMTEEEFRTTVLLCSNYYIVLHGSLTLRPPYVWDESQRTDSTSTNNAVGRFEIHVKAPKVIAPKQGNVSIMLMINLSTYYIDEWYRRMIDIDLRRTARVAPGID